MKNDNLDNEVFLKFKLLNFFIHDIFSERKIKIAGIHTIYNDKNEVTSYIKCYHHILINSILKHEGLFPYIASYKVGKDYEYAIKIKQLDDALIGLARLKGMKLDD
jgi:hypothetical protein